MKKLLATISGLSAVLLPALAFAEESTLNLDSSSILTTITSILSQNWVTIVAIAGIGIGVSWILRTLRKAAK